MNKADFLKPGVLKIVLFLVLMIGINYAVITFFSANGLSLAGLPLGFWLVGGGDLGAVKLSASVNFSALGFVVDIIFWYFIACGIGEFLRKGD